MNEPQGPAMTLELVNLDACTRRFMLAEFQADVAAGILYLSSNLSEEGRARYPGLLRRAIESGTEATLARDLNTPGTIELSERWKKPGATDPSEAVTATAVLLAEREFHRFYMRGLCQRAIHLSVPCLVLYRAKPAAMARTHDAAMVGVKITATSLLEDLSGPFRLQPPHGLPQCRDPGMSVRLP